MKRRQYNTEFKKDAAYQIIIEGVAVQELSDRLGVPTNQLYCWKAEHIEELEANNPGSAPSPKKMAAACCPWRE
jgi:transposase-like protein